MTTDGEVIEKDHMTDRHFENSFDNNDLSVNKTNQPINWRVKYVSLLLTFTALGFCSSISGPTMVDMEEYLGTDTKGMSTALSVHGLGYVIGSVFCGLVYDHFQPEVQLCINAMCLGAFTAAAPWSGNLIGYSITMAFRGFTMGFMDSSGQTYIFNVMKGHRLQDSAMQALHGVWSIGSTIGPFIIQPFLSDNIQPVLRNNSDIENRNLNSSTTNITSTSTLHLKHNSTGSGYFEANTKVPYAFLTIGVLSMIFAIPSLCAYLLEPKWCLRKKQKNKPRVTTEGKKLLKSFQVPILILLYFWFFCYLYAEGTPGSFLAVWVIKALKWPKFTGPLITSTLWGSHGVGRMLAIPLASALNPRQMLCLSTSMTSVSYILLLSLYQYHNIVVWITVASAGLGMSCSFATTILWASRHIPITGTASAVFLVGASTGDLTSPIFTGFMFQEYSPKWFLYIILTASLLNVFIFILLEIFVKCHKHNNDESIGNTTSVEELKSLKN